MSNPVCATVMVVGTVAIAGYEGYQYFSRKADLQKIDHIADRIGRTCGKSLTPEQRRRLHDEITGQGYSDEEIYRIGVGMFCPEKSSW